VNDGADGRSADRPDVSLVIVVYRTPDYLRRALEAIETARIACRYEVVVEDNAPLDEASAQLCAGRAQVVYERNAQNLGFGGGVNRGLARGRGRYYLILNPDVEVSAGGIEALVAFADENEDAGIIAPRLHNSDGTLQPSVRTFYTWPIFLLRRTFLGRFFPQARVLREHLMADWDHETTRDVDWCIGGAMLVRREAVEDVGPMDERFFLYFEDVDWCYRMHQRGWRVIYLPTARFVHHYQRASARGFWPKRSLWIHLGSLFRFYEKWSFLLYWLKLRAPLFRQFALALSDLAAVIAAFAAAYGMRGLAADLLTKPMFGFEHYARFLSFAAGMSLLFFALGGLYRGRIGASWIENVVPVTRAMTWTSAVLLASTFLFSDQTYSRVVVVLFFPTAILLVTTTRSFWLGALDQVRRRQINLHRIGLLGPPAAVEEALARFARYGRFGMEPVPILAPGGREETGEPSRLVRRMRQERVQEVLVFEEWGGDLGALLRGLQAAGLPVRIVPAVRDLLPASTALSTLLGLPTLALGAGAGRLRRGLGQRVLECVTALAAAMVLTPPFLWLALGRQLRGRPVLERQTLRGPAGRVVQAVRLARQTPDGSVASAVIGVFPSLPLLLSGAAGWTGLAPTAPATSLASSDPTAPPDAWLGLLGPWLFIDMPQADRAAWNRRYVQTWSPSEDLRILADVFAHRRSSR